MDFASLSLADLGNISERRIARLMDPASSRGLPAFLTRQGGLESGLMIAHYTAVALASECKVLAHPATADSIPTSANVEDHVSMAATAAHHCHSVLDNFERILAVELLCAAQGVDFRREMLGGKPRLGRGTGEVYDQIRSVVPFIDHDVVLAPYIEALSEAINSGAIAGAANV
jgi:histidine ammonia-lyase